MSDTRRGLKGVGTLSLIFVMLLIVQMISPFLGWDDPEVEEGFVIDEVTNGLGGPACLEWISNYDLLVCDRDGGTIKLLNFYIDSNDSSWTPTDNSSILLTDLHEPHDILILEDHILISERGKLTRINQTSLDQTLNEAPRWAIIDDVPTGNHQTNNLDIMPNGTVIWHVGSTCNICDEVDVQHALLCPGHLHRLGLRNGNACCDGCPCQLAHRRVRQDRCHRVPCPLCQPHRQQRVPTERKPVVIDPHTLHTQQLFPQPAQRRLLGCRWCHIPCCLQHWLGQRLAVELAVACQRERHKCHNHRRHHVARQLC